MASADRLLWVAEYRLTVWKKRPMTEYYPRNWQGYRNKPPQIEYVENHENAGFITRQTGAVQFDSGTAIQHLY